MLDWIALYDQQPWGDQRDDLRAFAAATISIAPHLERNAKLPEPEFPYWEAGATSPADALERMREFDERWQKS